MEKGFYMESVQIGPADQFNDALLRNAHPSDWENPAPARRYNLVVLGAGTAGLVSAAGAAMLGARVALVENRLMGGDCLNSGCVPSKALIRAARVWSEIRNASSFGFSADLAPQPDFKAAMERMRKLRARISEHDSARRFKEMGVDVFIGTGMFTSRDSIAVDGTTELRFKKAILATGSRPSVPPITGLEEAGYLTNETAFSLTAGPSRLAVIGGGPLGCELAQAFQRLGSSVTILEAGSGLVPRDDQEAGDMLTRVLKSEGIAIETGVAVDEIQGTEMGKVIRYSQSGESREITVDEILIAAGRRPNVKNRGLDRADIAFDEKRGVVVDDYLRTSNPNVYAAGDCCLRRKFTHSADASARTALRNALFPGKTPFNEYRVPWCTYTDPEIAHTGFTRAEAEAQGIGVDTFTADFSELDRALLDGEEQKGIVLIHLSSKSDRIVGATIVASHAGEMINELTLAVQQKLGMKRLAGTIHPYPTLAEAVKQAADSFSRKRVPLVVPALLSKLFWWIRQ